MPATVHVLGVLALDTIYAVPHIPGPGEKTFAHRSEYQPGGPAWFIARQAARLGADVMLHTAVGADAEGDKLIQFCDAAGIRTDTIPRLQSDRTPIAIVMRNESDQRAVLIVPVPEDRLQRFYGVHAHFGPGAVLIMHLLHPQPVRRAAERVRAVGGLSLLSLEWPEVERWGWADAMDAARQVDVICTNGQLLNARLGETSLTSARSFAADLAQGRIASCVDLGDDGVVVCAENRTIHYPASQTVPTLGAGETFVSTFGVALSEGYSPHEAAPLASHASASFQTGRECDLAALAAALRGQGGGRSVSLH